MKSLSKVSDEEMQWKAESAISTLKRAEEIKGDKELMGHVKKHAEKMMSVVNSTTGPSPKPKNKVAMAKKMMKRPIGNVGKKY